MVQIKQKPRHAEVWPPKCVVYMSPNPARYIIQWHRELFYKDQAARDAKKQDQYKRHVHTPQRKIQLQLRPRKLLIADVTRLQPFIVEGDSFQEHVEALISYNLRNDGYQQDCIYIEQGHLIMPTSFIMHSMAIDPRCTIVVSWMPIPLCILQAVSQPWCPPRLPSSTS